MPFRHTPPWRTPLVAVAAAATAAASLCCRCCPCHLCRLCGLCRLCRLCGLCRLAPPSASASTSNGMHAEYNAFNHAARAAACHMSTQTMSHTHTYAYLILHTYNSQPYNGRTLPDWQHVPSAADSSAAEASLWAGSAAVALAY